MRHVCACFSQIDHSHNGTCAIHIDIEAHRCHYRYSSWAQEDSIEMRSVAQAYDKIAKEVAVSCPTMSMMPFQMITLLYADISGSTASLYVTYAVSRR